MPGSFLHSFAKPTRESFISIVRGEGSLVWDSSGRELIDGMAEPAGAATAIALMTEAQASLFI